MSGFAYTDEALALQRRFDTEALAAAELQVIVHDSLSPQDRAFIAQAEMFWLASVDPKGSPTVSFKGGAPGFVRMPDDQTLLFPCFDGNGMFFSMGNIAATAHVGLLFMDFVTPSRLRVQGDAVLTDDPATGHQPIPGWKRIDAIQGVLPQRDQGKADQAGGLISMAQWGAMVGQGDPLA